MKKLFLIVALAAVTSTIFAQGTLQEGELQANAGLGFSSWGIPVIVGVDYGFTDEISLGGELSYRRKSFSNHLVNYSHTGIGLLAVGNYHFNNLLELPSPWDVYGGVSLGFYFGSTSNDSYKYNDGNTFGFRIQTGGRYFFTDQWGVNLELGTGSFTDGKFGVTYRF